MAVAAFELFCTTERHQAVSRLGTGAIVVLVSLFGAIESSGASVALLAHYQDNRSGREILVSGQTPQATAMRWLEEVTQARDEAALKRIQAAYARQGLKGFSGDAVVLGHSTVISQYKDTRTGRTVWVLGGTSEAMAGDWMREVNKADTAETLATLVQAVCLRQEWPPARLLSRCSGANLSTRSRLVQPATSSRCLTPW